MLKGILSCFSVVFFLSLLLSVQVHAENGPAARPGGSEIASHSEIEKHRSENEKLKAEVVETEERIARELEEARRSFLREIEKLMSEVHDSPDASPKTREPSNIDASSSAPSGSQGKTPHEGKKGKSSPHDFPDYIHVWPESKTFVPVSRIDLNRFVCSKGEISGVFFSNDKGLVVRKAGRNLFLRIIPDSFAFEHPVELYITCREDTEEQTYSMILTGEDISARTILLQWSAAARRATRESLPRTERIRSLVKQAYDESFNPRYTVKRVLEPVDYPLPKGIKIHRYLEVDAGDWVVELLFLSSSLDRPHTVREEAFVRDDTVAVSALTPVLPAGGFGRVVVIREKIKSIFEGG